MGMERVMRGIKGEEEGNGTGEGGEGKGKQEMGKEGR